MTDEEKAKKKREDEAAAAAAAAREGDDETVTVTLKNLKEVVRQTADDAVASHLKAAGIGKVKRERVAIVPNSEDGDEGEGGERGEIDERRYAGTAGRATPSFEALYRGLPEWERKIRTPEVDHYISDWAVGVMRNDHARMARAHAAIEGIPMWAREQRDLNLTDDAALVPSPLNNVIIEKKRKLQVIGPRAQSFTSVATTLDVPAETGYAAAAGVAEGGVITPADPTWGTVTLTKKKAVVATKSSVEFVEDNAFNAVNFLSAQAARTLALYNDAQDMRDGDGVGTNQTDAIEEAGITEVDAAVGTMVYADVTALWFALASQYRGQAAWLAPNEVIQILSEIVDTNDRPIFVMGTAPNDVLSGGQGAPGVGSIFGRPIFEVPATATVLALGDLNFYGVLNHGAIRAEFSKDVAFLTDELVWKWVQRRDGAVLVTEAFRKLGGITG